MLIPKEANDMDLASLFDVALIADHFVKLIYFNNFFLNFQDK